MDHFTYQNGILYAEDVAVSEIAQRFGTPTYVYSAATITRHMTVLQAAVSGLQTLICYAIKANGNLAIIEHLARLGSGFDAVSGGELLKAWKAGVPRDRIILSGVGKERWEIELALRGGIRYLCAESREELVLIADIAQALKMQAPVVIRVNPNVDAKTHPYISTGLKKNKFGVPQEEAMELARWVHAQGSLKLVGMSCHIGSQITTLAPFEDAATRMAQICKTLIYEGIGLEHVGIGGGLGIPYRADETPPEPKQYGEALVRILGPLGLQIVLEPGRVIVGNAGILLARVVRQKPGAERPFLVIDTGMNDLLRPPLYDAFHQIIPAVEAPLDAKFDVVGPICESADLMGRDVPLPSSIAPGDVVAIRSAGAYGFVMASMYNGRRRAAEVMVDGDVARVVRARDGFDELWRGEFHWDGTAADPQVPATI